VKVGKVGCHKEGLIVLWLHTQSFSEVEAMVIAGDKAKPENRRCGEVNQMISQVV
jgi:hypothetical protein